MYELYAFHVYTRGHTSIAVFVYMLAYIYVCVYVCMYDSCACLLGGEESKPKKKRFFGLMG